MELAFRAVRACEAARAGYFLGGSGGTDEFVGIWLASWPSTPEVEISCPPSELRIGVSCSRKGESVYCGSPVWATQCCVKSCVLPGPASQTPIVNGRGVLP